jgi:hypothetical protein
MMTVAARRMKALRQCTSARAQVRRRVTAYRKRKAEGCKLVKVRAPGPVRDMLVGAGILPAWDSEDCKAIGLAIERLHTLLVILENDIGGDLARLFRGQ